MLGAAMTGVHLRVASPPGFEPDPAIVAEARGYAATHGGSIAISNDPGTTVAGVDVVYTDVWASMGQEDEAEARRALFAPFQVDAQLFGRAAEDAVFLHCLPAHRGEEVTDEVIDGPQSVVFDEAENRLHAQKGILVWCLGGGAQ